MRKDCTVEKQKEINNINYDHLIFQDVFKEKNEKIKFPYSKGYYELKQIN